MSTEMEALEEFFAAINRNDMQAITKNFDPQIVRAKWDRACAAQYADRSLRGAAVPLAFRAHTAPHLPEVVECWQ